MANNATSAYEIAGPIIPLDVPNDRCDDTTPVLHQPVAVIGAAADDGIQLCGTLISISGTTTGVSKINIAPGAIYYHEVRNVLTYSGAAENTFGQINFGMPVYYDRSATMPATVKLSLSPLADDDAKNPLFGYIVWAQDEIPDPFVGDRDPYPTGSAIAGETHEDVAIMQAGPATGRVHLA